MNYLITGGAGFIGGHLSELLIKENHNVTVIDNLSTGDINNLSNIANHANFSFIEDDILTTDKLDSLIKNCDFVYHLAAAVGVDLVVKEPAKTIETNVHGTEVVLKYITKYNKKALITSTSEVYGKSTKAEFSETDDLLIGPSTHSRWSYACSKLLDEFYAMAFYRSHKTPITIVRLFNTVGPRQTGHYGMVVPRFVESAINNKNVTVYGNGEQTRCFCHVFDTIRALYKLSTTEDVAGKVFNIGNTHSISILQLAEKIIAETNSKSSIEFIPYSKAYEEGFEDMMHRKPNNSLIKETINWDTKLTLEDIIQDVQESMRN